MSHKFVHYLNSSETPPEVDSMNPKTKLNVCIQVHPNVLGIDYCRIALTPEVLLRLASLCRIVGGHQLDGAACTLTQVQWYKAGQEVTRKNYTSCTVRGNERDRDWHLEVVAVFWGEPSEHGGLKHSCTIQGTWPFLTVSGLDKENLLGNADSYGDVHAPLDQGDLMEAASSTAEFYRALFLSRTHTATLDRRPWPDPFDHWPVRMLGKSSARLRLPRSFQPEARLPVVDAVLEKILQDVLTQDCDPNQRCAFYTLAAALIVCPQDVALTRYVGDMPFFLRRVEHEISPQEESLSPEDLAPKRPGVCGTCDYKFNSSKVIRLRYQGIAGEITINTTRNETHAKWSTPRQLDNLALLYEDRSNNDFALAVMREFAHKYTDDLSRLKLLAFGLDALKRLLDNDYPWFDEVRLTMEDPDCWYEKSDSIFARGTKP